jgi:adenylylsulfate kinase
MRVPQRTAGAVVWFTGLSGAGKSTLAAAVRDRLAGRADVELLDGDEMRTYLTAGLGFSREDRDTNVRRIGYVARLLARHGVVVLASVISPYAATRAEVRAMVEADGNAFVEVFVRAELATVTARDVKGLYKRALAGEIANFTGVSDPYEMPTAPELEVRTDDATIADCAERVVGALTARDIVV